MLKQIPNLEYFINLILSFVQRIGGILVLSSSTLIFSIACFSANCAEVKNAFFLFCRIGGTQYDLRKLARRSGKIETKAFNYNCKMTNVNWIYPCPRPVFKTAWKFRTQTVRTFGAVALQLRIMYVCLRWDDISIKSPVGGPDLLANFLRSYFSKANSVLFPLGDKNLWHAGKLAFFLFNCAFCPNLEYFINLILSFVQRIGGC
jgi:hypothetical protein